ncbi:MAG: hypothetical protein ABIE55_01495 [Candidatus Aenigmatarchaeota archaeon]
MRGATLFLIVFVVLLVFTLIYPDFPVGRQIYDILGIPAVDEPILGIATTTMVSAVFNGVIYGFLAWLIFTFILKGMKK